MAHRHLIAIALLTLLPLASCGGGDEDNSNDGEDNAAANNAASDALGLPEDEEFFLGLDVEDFECAGDQWSANILDATTFEDTAPVDSVRVALWDIAGGEIVWTDTLTEQTGEAWVLAKSTAEAQVGCMDVGYAFLFFGLSADGHSRAEAEGYTGPLAGYQILGTDPPRQDVTIFASDEVARVEMVLFDGAAGEELARLDLEQADMGWQVTYDAGDYTSARVLLRGVLAYDASGELIGAMAAN